MPWSRMRYPRFREPDSLPSLFREYWEDPPRVHEGSPAPHGVARTDFSCYRFMSDHVTSASRTLETGLGMSTVLFALVGCEHTSVFLNESEGRVLEQWAEDRDVDLGRLDLHARSSDEGLRSIGQEPIDLFLIDGGHGYPFPQLDWFYGAPRLRIGGVLVLDDLHLWAPRQLDLFLRRDPRWKVLARTPKWSAYRRLAEGPVFEPYGMSITPSRTLRDPLLRRLHVWVSRRLPESVKAQLRRLYRLR